MQTPSKITVTAALTTPEGPVPSVTLDLFVNAHDMVFGGHHHGSDPLAVAPLAVTLLDSCVTEQNGQCAMTLTLPDASGEYAVEVVTFDRRVGKTATVTIGVPGLQPLPSSSEYRLTGTASQQGQGHLHNHYGGPALLTQIRILAARYQFAMSLLGSRATLGINDMSLPLGGLFDLDGVYTSSNGHRLHRFGDSVDIDQNHLEENGTLTPVNRQLLVGLATMLGMRKGKEPPHIQTHIHFERR
jgi:hypothetical protein